MSISIFYQAIREHPLNPRERDAIAELERQFAVEDQIREREQTGLGPNWESFCIDNPEKPTIPHAIFEGSTKLPDNSEEAMWIGLQHWCQLLTKIRELLPTADWSVHLDDHEIVWDDAQQAYDPSLS